MKWVGGAALLVGVSRLAVRARVPDDFDSIGFVRALERYDLAALQPHFPGYPVYVALGRAARLIWRAPLDAATAVSAAAAAATTVGVWRLARAAGENYAGENSAHEISAHKPSAGRISAGENSAFGNSATRTAWCAVALYAGAALPWVLGASALSDGTATALAVLAFAALVDQRPLAAGALAGLMLGARASYWPLAASFVAVAWRERRALAGLAAGVVAWAAPFAAVVGPVRLVALGRVHVVGHFTAWGGSIVTRPSLVERAGAFARDLAYDGVAPSLPLLGAVIALGLFGAWRRRPPRSRVVAIVALPYAAWVFVAQNVVEQPRHLLPLIVLALLAVAWAVAARPVAAAGAIAAVALAGAPLAVAPARVAPAAAQAVAWVKASFPRGDVAVFGGRAIRMFDELAPEIATRPRTWLSEVDVELARFDVLPSNVLVTSEVEIDPQRQRKITPGPTFCRDARLDRAQPCLQLFRYRLRGAP
jgi:hypothetical protein